MENPYQNRKAIENLDEFCGRKKEIKMIFTLISDAAEPHSISIVGEKKIGKSSLFHFVKNEAIRKKYLKDFDDYIFVCLELSNFLGYDTKRFCEMLLRELSSVTSEEMPSSCNNIYETLEKFIEILTSKGKKIIIMFDEFDNVLKIPAFKSDLPDYFRSLSCEYPLSFITFSRVSVRELTEIENSSHTETEDSSPFFNIFFNIGLGYLEKQDAKELIEKPSSRQGVRFNREDKDFINEIAFLHPFFIQIACCHLFDLRRKENKLNGEKLGKHVHDLLFQRFYEETVSYWDFYLNDMNQIEKDILLKICKGRKISNKEQKAVHRLRNNSLIYKEEGKWRIFSSAFAYYILR